MTMCNQYYWNLKGAHKNKDFIICRKKLNYDGYKKR